MGKAWKPNYAIGHPQPKTLSSRYPKGVYMTSAEYEKPAVVLSRSINKIEQKIVREVFMLAEFKSGLSFWRANFGMLLHMGFWFSFVRTYSNFFGGFP